MKKILFAFSLLLSPLVYAQCSSATLNQYIVQAHTTDNNIPLEIGANYAWFNPACTPKHLLLLHLVGSYDYPYSTTYFPKLAANNGFNVINLRYPNDTSAQQACRWSADTSCYENFRREILEGIDYSPDVAVDTTNCVYHRLVKLLQFLDAAHPTEGWGDFYSGNSINWPMIVVSGHSQGGGHAALIAKDHPVHGVLMFASPNDYSDYYNDAAGWTRLPHVTPDSAYYAFGNLYDDVVDFPEQYLQWNNLGLGVFGDTVRVNTGYCPYNYSHQLYTTDTASGLGAAHSLPVRDNVTPLDSAGNPVYQPVWEYMLRLSCMPLSVAAVVPGKAISIFPNPASDHLTITFGNSKQCSSVVVYNAMGQAQLRIENVTTTPVSLSLEGFAPGLYFVSVTSPDQRPVFQKLLVQ